MFNYACFNFVMFSPNFSDYSNIFDDVKYIILTSQL